MRPVLNHANFSNLMAPLDTWREDKAAIFHEKSVFTGMWVLVLMVGMRTMINLRSILEPLLWAFFLMMMLLPLADLIECALLRIASHMPGCLCCKCSRRAEVLSAEADKLERQYSGALSPSSRPAAPRPLIRTARSTAPQTADPDAEVGAEEEEGGCGCTRMVASLVTMMIFISGAVFFVLLIYKSANHMLQVWPYYEQGAQKLLDRVKVLQSHLPQEMADWAAKKVLAELQELLSFLAGSLFDHLSTMMIEVLMTLLYMVFWLCNPVFVGETVTGLFKRYILLKVGTSSVYGLCIYILLLVLQVDLAIVFGFLAFICSFVPEVGTVFAMVLPLPVILFDGRLERPILVAVVAFIGQLCLKLLFANIIEVKLVEKQHDFRMHPVTILFFVTLFGRIWGATGMLVSVPIMATAKASAEVMPPLYRDPILVLLEGDKDAPKRFAERMADRLQKAAQSGTS
mmetsp:Transcript_62521/g.136697  ORF Transcript_62521/g.136697 Transcript_62521/m.136697 type:complete len:458 (-) Transcript_62521:126-1499(-)|eukprot:CAMPEP_0206580998 /NCGR_PEP_ID=MMETSP0325_2-20121206/33535_1 /ASSEMBLY_ACC=CAM_ASM_000347 /TAXON_ID=2866 /ORGANISM="Crypthecodinium cohnii, Strain Seligo" /LENGTH=457 /DNA_ID=CAMNT_0054087221 /DNA_START=44 /DNA_END=1417 /DNA_ORIENTATION=-